jgi:N-acetylmuramoyl-L-alanine amidase
VRSINKIVVHHSAGSRATTVEQITKMHQARGFTDIGYHFVILWNGKVAKGRDIEKIGAHAKGHNVGSIGVCVTGDNTKPDLFWTEEQISCLRATVQTLCILFPEAEIYGHRDLPGAATECPGLNVKDLLSGGTYR